MEIRLTLAKDDIIQRIDIADSDNIREVLEAAVGDGVWKVTQMEILPDDLVNIYGYPEGAYVSKNPLDNNDIINDIDRLLNVSQKVEDARSYFFACQYTGQTLTFDQFNSMDVEVVKDLANWAEERINEIESPSDFVSRYIDYEAMGSDMITDYTTVYDEKTQCHYIIHNELAKDDIQKASVMKM